MQHGTFIWADLSSFHPEVTKEFYRKVMGWRFDDYVASVAAGPVAGLYEMPAKFQAINMPSFWMSYIAVDDVSAVTEIAKAKGGKVEVGPEPFEGGGTFALIRDPLGAGFTVYSGAALKGSATGAGARAGHGLFVSDAAAVTDFYSALFGWSFGPISDGVRPIQLNGQTIAHLHEIPDPAIRGKEQYWGVFFRHPNLQTAEANIVAQGGTILAHVELPEGAALLARDPDGGAFFLLGGGGNVITAKSPFRWKAWLGLGLILLSLGTGWTWIWAVFLSVWVWTGLREHATWLFEPIPRDGAALLYWSLMILYSGLAVLALLGIG